MTNQNIDHTCSCRCISSPRWHEHVGSCTFYIELQHISSRSTWIHHLCKTTLFLTRDAPQCGWFDLVWCQQKHTHGIFCHIISQQHPTVRAAKWFWTEVTYAYVMFCFLFLFEKDVAEITDNHGKQLPQTLVSLKRFDFCHDQPSFVQFN